jgi:Cu/Ag efflux protein CusF
VKTIFATILILILSACGKTPQAVAAQHYPLTGKVISLNPKEQTATIAAAAIPNFMEAMTMEYPVKAKSDFDVLRVGASIAGTVNVSDAGGYDLSAIKIQNPGK